MVSLKKWAILAAISPAFLLTGCGDSIVEMAQETDFVANKKTTLGAFFKESPLTQSVKWTEGKDQYAGEVAVATIEVKIPKDLRKQVEAYQEALKVERRAKLDKAIAYEREREIRETKEYIEKTRREVPLREDQGNPEREERFKKMMAEAESFISRNHQYQLKKLEENDVAIGPWLDVKSVRYVFTFGKNKKDEIFTAYGDQIYVWQDGKVYSNPYVGHMGHAMLIEMAGKKQFFGNVNARLADSLRETYRRAK